MSTVSDLLGRTQLKEFTSCAAIPAFAAPMGITLKRRRLIGKPEEKAKKPVSEGLIPDDAKPIDANSGTKTEGPADAPSSDRGEDQDLLPTSMALVAPDSTPGWCMPLSPTQIPKTVAPKPQDNPVAQPQPDTNTDVFAHKDRPLSVEGMVALGKSKSSGQSAAGFVAGIIQDSASAPNKTGDELLAQGKPMPEPTASNASVGVLKKFKFA